MEGELLMQQPVQPLIVRQWQQDRVILPARVTRAGRSGPSCPMTWAWPGAAELPLQEPSFFPTGSSTDLHWGVISCWEVF